MKKIVIRFGTYASILIVGVSFMFWLFSSETPNYTFAEIAGYASIILSMAFVFLGIRYYRDNEKNGSISFGEALKLGVLIVLIPSLAFGVYNFIYTEVMDPDFTETYYQYRVDQMKGTMSEADFEAAVQKMESEKAMFTNPVIGSLVMFLTVFLIGFVIALISALILKREGSAPSMAT
ncbi:DUF4199 domain-containing protein [Fulvivirgaceae bacterium BMA10]|uniref:DUF4199 domain-containing protein n=1 Tax=Splendidivirga corallicola TaxID=3051826 RepID=A0ABT8KZW1_9BACT|nr:DUF4199 domain-containing protein [Fulvivirgaceae bacterium BMA10]